MKNVSWDIDICTGCARGTFEWGLYARAFSFARFVQYIEADPR